MHSIIHRLALVLKVRLIEGMKIRTQNGFWAAVVAALFSAFIFAGMGASPVGASPWSFALVFAACLMIFLWPAAKNLYAVWRASLRNRDPAASRSGNSLPSGAPNQSDASRLPAPPLRLAAKSRARSSGRGRPK